LAGDCCAVESTLTVNVWNRFETTNSASFTDSAIRT
jgi:hypothetical protein